eukprot:gene16987-biopygen2289
MSLLLVERLCLGCATYSMWPVSSPTRADLQCIVSDKRGSGAGAALWSEFIGRVRAAGVPNSALRVECALPNRHALRWYAGRSPPLSPVLPADLPAALSPGGVRVRKFRGRGKLHDMQILCLRPQPAGTRIAYIVDTASAAVTVLHRKTLPALRRALVALGCVTPAQLRTGGTCTV